ncbi:leucyl-tRNA synthetase [Salipiger aestuarii]|uniref:DUF1127 domain-containing protein n=1 Tax=Salipiger aestuarii TaxID=568098 RepID=A0A327Y279_9RHOB|nr:hypothetical protein [Salipiger aestuarii]EIE49839.1 hypothetical protein C357_17463 [Citreicella sp. 357]KAA8607015.1 leucyl-tRNA synthetase [Salipiger aestuarii]KAA8610719.1 leucyl-tRNA synthetase [Salipiger aestuarii]KAB2541542.1 leucyl-tRNA synthetase [Salipiger aestuarii]RAK14156.1 hypothetical protein ATI53_102950 [Salipiger aestuarii]
MAFLTASHAHHDAPLLTRFFRAIGSALIAIAESNPRLRRVKALQRLSDEQLAAKGLRRDDIVRYVFGDVYYL